MIGRISKSVMCLELELLYCMCVDERNGDDEMEILLNGRNEIFVGLQILLIMPSLIVPFAACIQEMVKRDSPFMMQIDRYSTLNQFVYVYPIVIKMLCSLEWYTLIWCGIERNSFVFAIIM